MLSRKTKSKTKSVAERVASIILHPNGENSSDDSGEEATAPKVVDYDEDDYELPNAKCSDIRKRNIKMLAEQSDRYRGKISSRKDFEDSNSGTEQDSDGSRADDWNLFHNKQNILSADDSSMDQSESLDDDDVDEGSNVHAPDIINETNRQAEVSKGVCVQNQLNIWERLLELRIHTQKILNKCNLLPDPETIQQEKKENKSLPPVVEEAKFNLAKLLHHLLDLQHTLYGQFSEIKTDLNFPLKRSLPLMTDSKTDTPPTKRFAKHLEQSFTDFKPYRNAVLLKWDDRTKMLTPGAGSKKRSMHEEYDILRKIDNSLLNRSALIQKSQTLKTNAVDDVNDNKVDTHINDMSVQSHVYNDTDFYHQQLRELIEYKANSSSNAAEVTKQLIELQKLRQKMKKKVDTRASKGRKIRYTVHKKLINFMAPNDVSSWTGESTNELCKSLFAS